MTADGGTAPRDPGLQPERTRLAWRRTTLTCVVTALLGVRQALGADGFGARPATALALTVLATVGFLGVAHHRVLAMGAARPPAMALRAAVAAAGCAGALAVIGAVALR